MLCLLDLNVGGLTQAERRLGGDVLTSNLVPIQTQRLQFREVGHIHNAAETAQCELCSQATRGSVVTNNSVRMQEPWLGMTDL